MLATPRLRLAPEWDGRFTRMVALSGVAHVSIVVLALLLTVRGGPRPLPLVAYTVEITDPSALGGRLPPGRISTQPTPDAAAPAPAPGEPAAEQQPSVPEPPPAPEPEPVAKVEPPKPEPAKPDAVKIEPAKKPEPPKPSPKPAAKAEPKPPPKPVAEKPKPAPEKPAAEKPAAEKSSAEKPKPASEKPPQAAKPAGQGGAADADAPAKDAYAAAAERWRSRSQGLGLGGTDGGSGPIGTGGTGPGGGGQLVGLEFLAYRQTVITTVKGHWTNVVATPGLVAAVRFQIAADGALGGIRLERSSGNAAYDSSVLRAVQRTVQLPPPPSKYAKEFGEFVIEFHSEESGGKGSG